MGDYVDAIVHSDKKRFDPSTIDEKYRMIDHYDHRLPGMSKINHVEITCNIQL